ncbi:zinc finger protein 135-like [Dunckerocampus dactyliophorus]|uniref:zinc finger protein 135-like n=1 Tax=Dunckerocampus dactyliophorus TaxID=161453 RepID=UPI00240532B3|nr:zinc finger protein 135-like [Dunckerocampus dactyliophorus]XP_054629693.1 zinc finger protein 135-like [Dunckerocampus dactyliophorus]
MNHCCAKMATSSQREGGSESAPQTPSTSSTEKKPPTADVQQLIGHHKEYPNEPQEGTSTLKQEDSPFSHVKEEEEELWITQEREHRLGPEEDDLTKLPLTGFSVKTEDHEDKPLQSLGMLCPSDVLQLIGHQKEHPSQPQWGSSTLKQEDPQPAHVKEEEEELWTMQEGECLLGLEEADLTKLPLTDVCVKTEDHEDKPPESSQLHHSPSEENRGAEPPSSSRSSQHMTTEADGDHCGGSQANNLLAPLSDSDDTASHSSEDEDRDDTQEPLSSDADFEGDTRTLSGNKHPGCSKKKTGKTCFTCSFCGKSCSRKGHLTCHLLKHTGEKPFSCSVCPKSFAYKTSLTHHMLKHRGEKPYSCSVCAKNFSYKTSLTHHMLKHTGEKPFSCSVCAKNFAYKTNLTYHMMKHTGEKPFSCSVCAEKFSYKGSLTHHMLKHTGEKPYVYSVVGERFPPKTHTVSHVTTHTEQKLFSCSICGKNYSYKYLLNVHMIMHSKEKGRQEGSVLDSQPKHYWNQKGFEWSF